MLRTTMKMETRTSDHQGLTMCDTDTSSWLTLWDEDFSAVTGMTLGAGSDLAKAIGDKEVAAKAVAFVVNSTRKGIVPLCADVANLFRLKRRLEEKLIKVARENELMRQSLAEAGRPIPSISGSPVIRTKTPCGPDQDRCSSVCSNRSFPDSAVYDGPHLAQADLPVHSFFPVSPAVAGEERQIIVHPVVTEGDHIAEDDSLTFDDEIGAENTKPNWSHHQSVGSLPEYTNTRNVKTERADSDRSTQSSGKCWNHTTEEQLHKTIRINNKLSEELHAAKSTITQLQRTVEEMKLHKNNNIEDCAETDETSFIQDCGTLNAEEPADAQQSGDLFSPCHLCVTSQVSVANGATGSPCTNPSTSKHDSNSILISSSLRVFVGDTVLTRTGRKGAVRFVGHLDGFAPSCIFIGLQLHEKAPGCHDGSFGGKKYFSCSKGSGLFIQSHDIANTLTQKSSLSKHGSRKASSMSKLSPTSSSRTSSSSSASGPSFVSKLMSRAANLKHTHSSKRISLSRSQSHEVNRTTANQMSMDTTILAQSESEALPNGMV